MHRCFKIVFFLVCGCLQFSQNTTAQASNYLFYHQSLRMVDQDILDSNFNLALRRLDTIQNTYTFIFGNDCIKALQLAIVQQDSSRICNWLSQCFIQGVPEWILKVNTIKKRVYTLSYCNPIVAKKEIFDQQYRRLIDSSAKQKIEKLYQRDQWITNHLNDASTVAIPFYYFLWLRNNRHSKRAILKICRSKHYPGEQLIGIQPYYFDSTLASDQLRRFGPTVQNQMAFYMLLHYYTIARKQQPRIWFQALQDGYLTPYEFGSIHDFICTAKRLKPISCIHYNCWLKTKEESNQNAINQRRNQIGLPDLQQQQRIDSLLLDRRKNKIMNNCIILQ